MSTTRSRSTLGLCLSLPSVRPTSPHVQNRTAGRSSSRTARVRVQLSLRVQKLYDMSDWPCLAQLKPVTLVRELESYFSTAPLSNAVVRVRHGATPRRGRVFLQADNGCLLRAITEVHEFFTTSQTGLFVSFMIIRC